MIFNSGWSKSDIEGLTYRELVNYVNVLFKTEAEKLFDFFKMFSLYNCESTAVGTHGKKSERQSYMNAVFKKKLVIEHEDDDHFDNQFEGS